MKHGDESKPLAAAAQNAREIATKGFPKEWRGHFAERPLLRIPKPVEFLNNKTAMVAVQLADLAAASCSRPAEYLKVGRRTR